MGRLLLCELAARGTPAGRRRQCGPSAQGRLVGGLLRAGSRRLPVVERVGSVFVDVSGLAVSPVQEEQQVDSLSHLTGPKTLLLLSNLHQIDRTKIHLTLEEWAAKYGPTYQVHLGRRRVVVSADPL